MMLDMDKTDEETIEYLRQIEPVDDFMDQVDSADLDFIDLKELIEELLDYVVLGDEVKPDIAELKEKVETICEYIDVFQSVLKYRPSISIDKPSPAELIDKIERRYI